MRQVREVLRLKHVARHGERRFAAAIGISRYSVAEYDNGCSAIAPSTGYAKPGS